MGNSTGLTAANSSNPLNANTLKIIAMALMLLDHFAVVFFPGGTLLHMLFRFPGRIVAPVICFFIAEGYHYTSNRKNYVLRLLALAVISHIPFNITFGHTLSPFEATSVIWALAMGLIALSALKSEKLHVIVKAAVLALCCALAWTANWNFVAVLWIAAFGLFHGNFKRQILSFCAVGIVFHLALVYHRFGLSHWFQFGIFLAIPLLALYNGKLGKKSKVMAYSFYVFYPAHLLLLFFLDRFTALAQFLGK